MASAQNKRKPQPAQQCACHCFLWKPLASARGEEIGLDLIHKGFLTQRLGAGATLSAGLERHRLVSTPVNQQNKGDYGTESP